MKGSKEGEEKGGVEGGGWKVEDGRWGRKEGRWRMEGGEGEDGR